MNHLVGSHDLVLLTFDTLRYDVAESEWSAGGTPALRRLLPGGWERRHSPGSFTYSAHQAFFAGFLPTPATPDPSHQRLFAAEFAGSTTAGPRTKVFDTADIVTGLGADGYHTLCIGGVGFFNGLTPLARVLPSLFDEAHWHPGLGVADPQSARNQFGLAARRLAEIPASQRVFLFVNISALHQPNCCYLPGAAEDSIGSHAAALRYVDSQLPVLLAALASRGPAFLILCSDHGTLYGEDGFTGHRVGHEHVYTVPYGEAFSTASHD